MNNNPYINEYGTKYWENDEGQLHRIDGPACEYAHGSKEWCINNYNISSIDNFLYWLKNE